MRRAVGPLVLLTAMVAGNPALSNEFGNSHAWQFRTLSERAVAASITDMMERRRAGGYGPATLTNNNFLGTNIAGDYIACEIAATATGNAGTTSVTGASSSPTLLNQPVVSASTVGNTSSGFTTGGTATGTQGNYDSGLTSSVGGTSSTLSSGQINASGGVLNQTITSTQTNTNSPQTATVAGSNACYFAGR